LKLALADAKETIKSLKDTIRTLKADNKAELKAAKEKATKPGFMFMYKMGAYAALVSAVEVILILGGFLPPVLSYSPANLFFMFVRLALVVHIGIAYARQDLKISAITGAFVAFCGIFVLTMAATLNFLYIHKSVLGILIWSRQELFILMTSTILQNAAIGVVVGGAAGWLSLKFAKK